MTVRQLDWFFPLNYYLSYWLIHEQHKEKCQTITFSIIGWSSWKNKLLKYSYLFMNNIFLMRCERKVGHTWNNNEKTSWLLCFLLLLFTPPSPVLTSSGIVLVSPDHNLMQLFWFLREKSTFPLSVDHPPPESGLQWACTSLNLCF